MEVKHKYNPVSFVCHAVITGALLMNANTIAFADDDENENDDQALFLTVLQQSPVVHRALLASGFMLSGWYWPFSQVRL